MNRTAWFCLALISAAACTEGTVSEGFEFAQGRQELSEKCKNLVTMQALYVLGTEEASETINELGDVLCAEENARPSQTLKYSNGEIAYVGREYAEEGRWLYSNGKVAFEDPSSQSAGSWRFPDGSIAFAGPRVEGAGSWYYARGKATRDNEQRIAFVGDKRSSKYGTWKYPDGRVAMEMRSRSEVGSWMYPSGVIALDNQQTPNLETGSWKYPNGRLAFAGPRTTSAGSWFSADGDVLSRMARDHKPDAEGREFVRWVEHQTEKEYQPKINVGVENALPRELELMLRLMWIEEVLSR